MLKYGNGYMSYIMPPLGRVCVHDPFGCQQNQVQRIFIVITMAKMIAQ